MWKISIGRYEALILLRDVGWRMEDLRMYLT